MNLPGETPIPSPPAKPSREERLAYWRRKQANAVAQQANDCPQQAKIVCRQCQTAGGVTTFASKRKVGVSGGKATAAILTGGLSLLATGLARKGEFTIASCTNCGLSYDI